MWSCGCDCPNRNRDLRHPRARRPCHLGHAAIRLGAGFGTSPVVARMSHQQGGMGVSPMWSCGCDCPNRNRDLRHPRARRPCHLGHAAIRLGAGFGTSPVVARMSHRQGGMGVSPMLSRDCDGPNWVRDLRHPRARRPCYLDGLAFALRSSHRPPASCPVACGARTAFPPYAPPRMILPKSRGCVRAHLVLEISLPLS
jgi:hypothetical protein